MAQNAVSEKREKEFHVQWSKIVMAKNDGFCVCGCGQMATDPHHVFSKGSSSFMTSYDPDNGVPMSRECHTKYHASKNDDIEMAIWEYFENFNIVYDALKFKSKQSPKNTFENWQIVENHLLERSVIKRVVTAGIYEFEYNNQKRLCKKECGDKTKVRTDECQATCRDCLQVPFIVRKDGVELARVPANGPQGFKHKLGSELMMAEGYLRFIEKCGCLLDTGEIEKKVKANG